MKDLNLFEITEKDKENARKQYGRTVEEVKKDCDIIRDWMKQQAHFPDDYDSSRIEYFLMRNKFRVERTKEKLENYYTVRAQNIEFLKCMDPISERIQTCFTAIEMAISPKIFNQTERIAFQRFTKNDEAYSLEDNLLMLLALSELEPLYDYTTGMQVVIDYQNFSMTHLKSMNNINLISKMLFMYQECLSGRFIAIHVVNAPSIFSLLLDILKIALPPKLYKKLIIHQNLDSLKAVVPEKYLLSDYGGNLPSYSEMQELFKEVMVQNREYILNRLQFVADESKRVGEVKKNDLFGIDGTFKKINID